MGTSVRPIHIAGIVSTCLYAAVSSLSWRFVPSVPTLERPLLWVLGLFTLAFGIYAIVCLSVIRWPRTRADPSLSSDHQQLKAVVLWAVVFRLVMIVSAPIQEVDLYRYLWDGAVAAQGISPFQHSPADVLAAVDASMPVEPSMRTDVEKLAELARSRPGLLETLRRVHFAHLPTVYPSTSQAVFAAAYVTTPSDASVNLRTLILKFWLTGFDLLTLFLIILCLRLASRPVSWCVVYAWCPLVLKEVTNSGHLDAIAVMLTTLALWLLARAAIGSTNKRSRPIRMGWLASGALALAVGAKLYPIVLAPLFAGVLLQRLGSRTATLGLATIVIGSFALLSPMLPERSSTPPVAETVSGDGFVDLDPPSLVDESSSGSLSGKVVNDPSRGMKTFLKQWEMNDFLFLIVVENLRPEKAIDATPWFVFVPKSIRYDMTMKVADSLELDPTETPFLIARCLTALLFAAIAIGLAWHAMRQDNMNGWMEAAFLTVAWFWLLCPTQNPWYWTWALPMLPFVRNRAWIAMSGLVFLYYTRFWFRAHFEDRIVWPTGYQGTTFFDLVVPWIEFGPILLLIATTAWLRKERTCSGAIE